MPIEKKWAKIKLTQDLMAIPITFKFDEDPIKNKGIIARTTFSLIICLKDLSVALEARILTRSTPNLILPVPNANDGTCEIWSRLANWLREFLVQKGGLTHGRSLAFYYKLILWAFGPGELKHSSLLLWHIHLPQSNTCLPKFPYPNIGIKIWRQNQTKSNFTPPKLIPVSAAGKNLSTQIIWTGMINQYQIRIPCIYWQLSLYIRLRKKTSSTILWQDPPRTNRYVRKTTGRTVNGKRTSG